MAAVRIDAGLVQREVLLLRSVSVELLGPGDLIDLREQPDELLPTATSFAALATTEISLFNAAALQGLTGRPDVVRLLVEQAASQHRRMALHRAICQLPRVDERLPAFLWLLAERWGRVGRSGVHVPMRLSHEILGRLVGARRPTVSLALRGLAETGAVTRGPDGTWLLDPACQPDLAATIAPPPPAAFLLDQPRHLHAVVPPNAALA